MSTKNRRGISFSAEFRTFDTAIPRLKTDAFAGSINRFLPQCIMGRFYCKQHGLQYLIGNLTNEGIKLIGFLSFFRQKRQESFIYFDRL
jgi:hypothetical protein